MSDPSNPPAPTGQTQNPAPKAKPQNPAMRMMGMPNFRFKLPSRNWMIFFSVTGSFTAALLYDRREKKRAQQKWCDLVAHLSKESLPIDQTRRKITVFLSAPPGDGIRNARDHFKQYVKPILVAAALDYNVIEGRREGDVRAGLAERIRKDRRSNGEPSSVVLEPGVEDVVADARQKIGVTEEPGPKGDLVIGRHTWKEYIRGLHEGWLGPLDPPPPPPSAVPEEPTIPETPVASETATAVEGSSADSAPTTEASEENKKPEEPSEEKKPEEEKKEEKPKPTGPTPAYLAPADYSSQQLPATLPPTLAGSVPVPFPHILGFLNTPIRIWRYLNQRSLADHVGREVAGLVLASYSRPYVDGGSGNTEQQTALEEEEKEWHKSVHRTDEANPDREREWLNDIVLDPRIASRMHRYTVSPDEEARSHRILHGEEYILGEERPAPVSFWQHLWIKYGYGEDAETLKRKVILGDLDSEGDQ